MNNVPFLFLRKVFRTVSRFQISLLDDSRQKNQRRNVKLFAINNVPWNVAICPKSTATRQRRMTINSTYTYCFLFSNVIFFVVKILALHHSNVHVHTVVNTIQATYLELISTQQWNIEFPILILIKFLWTCGSDFQPCLFEIESTTNSKDGHNSWSPQISHFLASCNSRSQIAVSRK